MPSQNDQEAAQGIEQLSNTTDAMASNMLELAKLVHHLASEGNTDLMQAHERLLKATRAVLIGLDEGLTLLKTALARSEPVDVDTHLAHTIGLLQQPMIRLNAEVAAISMMITSTAPVLQLEQARFALDRFFPTGSKDR